MLHLESCCNSRCVENSRNRISLTLFPETPIFRKSWKANGSIKRHLCKLTQETQESWFKVLPVPLMRAQTAPPCPHKMGLSQWQTAFVHRYCHRSQSLRTNCDSAFSFSTSSSTGGFPWWVSLLQGKDFLQLCEYPHQQQTYVMPLLDLMTPSNLKMDWCNYGHKCNF